ncbi:hypothetical protein BAE44_0002645 [Dichanthelium oligosanthes]|uniref:Uncharacterized protein n=1 Tax=Dichanthelium oligosanthes TaxID=888268 RepID=A0A1E5WG03_9POAL|nr:hypothetical protein BAE44_0002645 [Dichanthelium oligosanthes]
MYFYQVIEGEGADRENLSACFEEWLAKELNDLHMHAACAVPNDFPKNAVWNWEFNEEFERYLPAYMNMLVEVDAMDDCLEVTCGFYSKCLLQDYASSFTAFFTERRPFRYSND